MKTKNITTFEDFKELNYGKPGTKKRDELEAGYENFKIGALLYEARCEKRLTHKTQRLLKEFASFLATGFPRNDGANL